MVSYEKKIPLTSEIIVIKETVLKHLLAFRHVGNTPLNRPAEPIANTKVNLDPFSLHIWLENAIPCSYPSVTVGCWERVELLCSHFLLWVSGFSLHQGLNSALQCTSTECKRKNSFSLSKSHLIL